MNGYRIEAGADPQESRSIPGEKPEESRSNYGGYLEIATINGLRVE